MHDCNHFFFLQLLPLVESAGSSPAEQALLPFLKSIKLERYETVLFDNGFEALDDLLLIGLFLSLSCPPPLSASFHLAGQSSDFVEIPVRILLSFRQVANM